MLCLLFLVLLFSFGSHSIKTDLLLHSLQEIIRFKRIGYQSWFCNDKRSGDIQSINPLLIVLLTPIIMGLFGWLRARGKEPSTPKKIAIGMGIAALAYVVMAIGSYDLPLKSELDAMGGLSDAERVTPFLLIGTYFILTVAELFISPLGISFVSKVAPPHLQGVMQGGWLGATAIGNQLLFIGAILYESVPIWLTWTVFIIACTLSMLIMLSMLRWLERVAK